MLPLADGEAAPHPGITLFSWLRSRGGHRVFPNQFSAVLGRFLVFWLEL